MGAVTTTEKTALRVSVRDLVEFSYFPEDILPSGGMEELWAGTRAHQARQKKQQGEVERALKQVFCCLGERITVYGRMDAFTPGEVPFVEEMKLAYAASTPREAFPAHRAQALTYAAMVAIQQDSLQVGFCVSYVSEEGEVLAAFQEQLSRQQLFAELAALLEPYMAFAVAEKAHRDARDASLAELPFPFPTYREGQREMAAQVYTAITRKRRLFASLPTGTGKSAAVLFPALKALGQGKTGKIIYLTARTTARQSPLMALEQMLGLGLEARIMTLSAKEKMCAGYARCHPAECPRAKGHYLRLGDALQEITACKELWTDPVVTALADKHLLCPFEFALALTELADVAVMDLNYAFDPFAQLKRIFQFRRDVTLLVDEAHHVVDRVRESLSGALDSGVLRDCRVRFGKAVGRKHPYYKALTQAIDALRAVGFGGEEKQPGDEEGRGNEEGRGSGEGRGNEEGRGSGEGRGNEEGRGSGEAGRQDRQEPLAVEPLPKEGVLQELPAPVEEAARTLCLAAYQLLGNPVPHGEVMADASMVLRLCAPFLHAAEHLDEDYAVLLTKHGKERVVELYCLLPAKEIARVTKRLQGTVFFSATMAPLSATKQLLGGGEEDACFALPSPFPKENLAVVRQRVNTRYGTREETAPAVAEGIAEAVLSRPGKYIAYFPSYAYLRMIERHLRDMALLPLLVQSQEMDEAARQAFLEAFTTDQEAKLGLCVLGSLFSEGIDLPGEQLIGAIIVGVGLPVPSLRLKTVQACYQRHFGDGFAFACRIPGMQKVVQAAGRVIRAEEDRGIVVLADERYFLREYEQLLPEHWRFCKESISQANRRLTEGEAE